MSSNATTTWAQLSLLASGSYISHKSPASFLNIDDLNAFDLRMPGQSK